WIEGETEVNVLAAPNAAAPLLRLAHRLHFYPSTETFAIKLYNSVFAPRLTQLLRNCDVVHFNGTGRELLGFSALEAARRMGAPVLATPHMHPGSWGDSELDYRFYRSLDGILPHTCTERQYYVAGGVEPDRVHVVGIGVNTTGEGDGERFRKA